MTKDLPQESDSTSTPGTGVLVPVDAEPPPVSSEARAYVAAHGDVAHWSAEQWRPYLELGGIQ